MSEKKVNSNDIVELVVNGELLGVFSSDKVAEKHMKTNLQGYSYSILPIGTLLITDM